MYCDFTADKRYQLADWRIRPLPTEMLDYARCDTHFLLYIYDNLRNALIAPRTPPPQQKPFEAASPLLEVIRRSSEKALKVYVREVYDAEGGTGPGGWEVLCRKWNKNTGFGNDVHSEVFKAIHAWRDRVARKEDESTRYFFLFFGYGFSVLFKLCLSDMSFRIIISSVFLNDCLPIYKAYCQSSTLYLLLFGQSL